MTTSDKATHEIRKIAYALWIRDGQPAGRDREHWEAAKEMWAYRAARHEEIPIGLNDAGREKVARTLPREGRH